MFYDNKNLSKISYPFWYENYDEGDMTDETNLMINSFNLKELDNVVDDGEDDDW